MVCDPMVSNPPQNSLLFVLSHICPFFFFLSFCLVQWLLEPAMGPLVVSPGLSFDLCKLSLWWGHHLFLSLRSVVPKGWCQMSGSTSTWKLDRNAHSQAPTQFYRVQSCGVGPSNLYCRKPFSCVWCKLRFENHWYKWRLLRSGLPNLYYWPWFHTL